MGSCFLSEFNLKHLPSNWSAFPVLKSAHDGRMHHATYTFLDHDPFKTTWTFHKDPNNGQAAKTPVVVCGRAFDETRS